MIQSTWIRIRIDDDKEPPVAPFPFGDVVGDEDSLRGCVSPPGRIAPFSLLLNPQNTIKLTSEKH